MSDDTITSEARQALASTPCLPPYLAEETVGEIIRWIDREHMNAAKEMPPNRDYMRAMQQLGRQVEHALDHYRKSTANAERTGSAGQPNEN